MLVSLSSSHVCITSTTPYIIGKSDIIDITTSTQNKLITYTSNNSDDTTMEDTTIREDEVIVEEVRGQIKFQFQLNLTQHK
jgi:hypothetical protein